MLLQSGRFFSSNDSDSDSSDSNSIEEQLVPSSSVDNHPIVPVLIPREQTDPKVVQEQSTSFDFDLSSPAFSSFLKNPSKFVSNVPKLKSDGSNFTHWSKGLDTVFMYIFNKVLFTDDPNNFEIFPQAKGALRFFIQQTISPDLSEMIQNEVSPKRAFIEIQNNFKKSTRLTQLDLVIELFDMFNSIKSLKPNNVFSRLFTLFDKFRRVGIPLSTEWGSLIVQVFAPIPSGMTRYSWFHSISVELDRLDKIGPRDVQ
ncbi:hypothetical protein O181_077893 [Austropuccinia psidii MF-1]|uniref:Uncharacterized protein n=1 Tax=Austropuccinia psidii MF-1 TaxID=1389203 RepID=A0A9Q3IE51_9BASI|nr:hypothetical protein [Austropuccinia psidii MF-1]